MGFEELAPRRSLAPLRSGVDSVLLQDVTDRGAPDSMTDVLECPLDSRVSPSSILPCNANDQVGDEIHDPGPAGGPTLVRPLLGNQSPVPAKDGVGSHERCDFAKSPSADRLAANGKPSPLRVGQSKSSSTELLLEDAVLFSKIVDDRILLAGDPTGHGGYEDLPGIEHRCHPSIVARSRTDRQLST